MEKIKTENIDKLVSLKEDELEKIFNNHGATTKETAVSKKIIKDVIDNKLKQEEINEEIYTKYLYQDLPDVDLMIRTSGELRLSNFMLWQNSYAEFYFPKTYFPDFDEKEFDKAIIEYTKRDRRYGNIDYNK